MKFQIFGFQIFIRILNFGIGRWNLLECTSLNHSSQNCLHGEHCYNVYNYFMSKSKTPSKTTVQVAATQVNLASTEEEEVLSALENASQPSGESRMER